MKDQGRRLNQLIQRNTEGIANLRTEFAAIRILLQQQTRRTNGREGISTAEAAEIMQEMQHLFEAVDSAKDEVKALKVSHATMEESQNRLICHHSGHKNCNIEVTDEATNKKQSETKSSFLKCLTILAVTLLLTTPVTTDRSPHQTRMQKTDLADQKNRHEHALKTHKNTMDGQMRELRRQSKEGSTMLDNNYRRIAAEQSPLIAELKRKLDQQEEELRECQDELHQQEMAAEENGQKCYLFSFNILASLCVMWSKFMSVRLAGEAALDQRPGAEIWLRSWVIDKIFKL